MISLVSINFNLTILFHFAAFLKPVVIGLVVIVSGLLIARTKPKARTLAIYSIVITIITGIILFSLAFVACNKKPIVEGNQNGM